MERLFVCLLLAAAPKLAAMYVGNPSSPMMPEQGVIFSHSWASLKAGYEFDNIFNRKLKMQTHHLDAEDHKYTSRGQFGVLTLGLGDRVEIYSGLGSLRAELSQKIDGSRIDYRTDSHFAASVGGRALFAYWGNVQVGLAASYLHFFPSLRSIEVDGTSVEKGDAEMQYHEWQVSVGISYHIWWLFPYIGADYSNVTAKFRNLDKDFTLDNQKHYGVFLGCGLSPEKGFSINAEGRFIDEKAFTISANVRF
jgi:Chlamydia major outer membrane protein